MDDYGRGFWCGFIAGAACATVWLLAFVLMATH